MQTEYNTIQHKGKELEEIIPDAITPTRRRKQKLVTATPKKKSLLSRTFNSLVSKEDADSLQDVLINEVLLPAVKSIILDMVTTGITTALYGKNGSNRPTNYRQSSYSQPRTNYNQSYTQNQTRKPNTPTKRNYDYGTDGRTYVNEYVIANRHEAIMILDELRNSISMYGSVSVSDYYDYIGHESAYTDFNYGWINLERVPITASKGGFILNLPPVETI